MKYVVTPEQVEVLKKNIQNIIDYALNSIRTESEDWGMGEMDELIEIFAIDKIEVVDIEYQGRLVVYVDIYQNNNRNDFEYVIFEIQDALKNMFPEIVIHINEVHLS